MSVPSLSRHVPMPKVAEVCGGNAEVLAPSVARFVSTGYVTRDIACRDAAFDGAETLLGAEAGGGFVARIVGIVRALRAERADEGSFMPATCCRLTGHECALIGRGRGRLWDQVDRGAAALTGRPEAPRLVAALRAAVESIDAAAGSLGRASLH